MSEKEESSGNKSIFHISIDHQLRLSTIITSMVSIGTIISAGYGLAAYEEIQRERIPIYFYNKGIENSKRFVDNNESLKNIRQLLKNDDLEKMEILRISFGLALTSAIGHFLYSVWFISTYQRGRKAYKRFLLLGIHIISFTLLLVAFSLPISNSIHPTFELRIYYGIVIVHAFVSLHIILMTIIHMQTTSNGNEDENIEAQEIIEMQKDEESLKNSTTIDENDTQLKMTIKNA